MRTIISFAALFLSAAFVQLSSGALSPLDALAGKMKTGWMKGLKLPAMDLRTLDSMRASMRKRRAALAKGKALGQRGELDRRPYPM